MNTDIEIGILLTNRVDNVSTGMVILDNSGMMIYRILKKGLHPYAMKSIQQFFNDKYEGEPLYKKYASQLSTNGKIPDDILWSEAIEISKVMNTHGVSVAAKSVMAKAVKFQTDSSRGLVVVLDDD